jgi:hypothetical protein
MRQARAELSETLREKVKFGNTFRIVFTVRTNRRR